MVKFKSNIGVYPGTFDPVTFGHLDIVKRAAPLFSELIVGVAEHTGKDHLFSTKERIEMMQDALPKSLKNINVMPVKGLLVDFARETGATFIVRGLRAVSDFEYEFKMCVMNRRLEGNLETLFLMASEENQFVSSTFVKEIGRLGGDISSFVPKCITKRLLTRLKKD